MHRHQSHREAYNAALRFEHLVFRIIDGITAEHPREAEELAEYTNQMLKSLRNSNGRIATKKGREQSLQAAVWMVEALIILMSLKEEHVEPASVTAAIELLERCEDALRAEGSLPPAMN